MKADGKLLSASPTDTGSAISLPVVEPSQSVPENKSWKDHVRQLWKWTPPPARYDPDNPPKFTVWINLLFAFVSRPDLPPRSIPDTPGRLLHRVQPILQPSRAQQDRRDL